MREALERLLALAEEIGVTDTPAWRDVEDFIFSSKLGFDWKTVHRALEKLPWEPETPGLMVRRHSIGLVQDLTPSGKFYTGWAGDHVPVCRACRARLAVPCSEEDPCLHGVAHCPGCKDATWKEQLEKEANGCGFYIESGENPEEIFACHSKEVSFCPECGSNYPEPDWHLCQECTVALIQPGD